MKNLTNIAIKTAASLLLLLSAAACTPTQTSPSMEEFSYTPPSKIGAPAANYGLEDY